MPGNLCYTVKSCRLSVLIAHFDLEESCILHHCSLLQKVLPGQNVFSNIVF